ncbi:MAG TPA: helix-turn-helix domain-containing protein [Solirubrobacterales bacterium]|nr:helix-turn-helix domain-containing protein [Solirubrobacterales bacterium]
MDQMSDDKRRKKTLAHPLRSRIFGCLDGGRELPTTVICGEVDEQLSVVAYHLRVLEATGLVRAEGTTRPVWSRR